MNDRWRDEGRTADADAERPGDDDVDTAVENESVSDVPVPLDAPLEAPIEDFAEQLRIEIVDDDDR